VLGNPGAAKAENADIIGLSGLITPSLEEMAYVAKEMQRDPHFRMLKIPLLIGGATTSRAHTAVKIAHNYEGPVVYVPDASRSVSVAQSLLTPEQRDQYVEEIAADYERIREQHANKKAVPMLSLAEARANKESRFTGKPRAGQAEVHRPPRVQECRSGDLARYIDWGPFFQTWDLAGPIPPS
jgi:5-methyltetrahydrofolate--homocysteine methyltransferase